MSDELLRTIAENPDDDTPRLVYADWLEEHGDAERAEYIRFECRFPREMRFLEENREKYRRYAHIHSDNYESWGEALFRCGVKKYETERGMIHSIRIAPRNFAKHGEVILRAAPTIRELVLVPSFDHIGALAESPGLRDIRSIKFDFQSGRRRLRDRGLTAFSRSPHLGNLAKLSIQYHEITSRGIRALAESPNLNSLEELDLYDNELGDEGAELLAASPRLAKVRACELFFNRIGLAGITALAASRSIVESAEWGIACNSIGDEGWLRIMESAHPKVFYPYAFLGMSLTETAIDHLIHFGDKLPGVGAFRWHGEGLTPGALRRLVNSDFFARIREFDLEDCAGFEAAVCDVIRSERFVEVRELRLRRMGLTKRTCDALASSPYVCNIESMDLSQNQFTNPALLLLAGSDNLKRLNYLNLWGKKFRRKTGEALERRFQDVFLDDG